MFVKICGVTSEADALLCVAMGADAVGFNFVNGSVRQITPQMAGDIAKRLPPEVLTVGIFRNHLPKDVVEIVNRQGLGAAQLHGDENTEDTQWVAERVPRTMKCFVAGSDKARRARDWGTNPILIDAPRPGSGESYDYSLARRVPSGLAVVLAGGLHPGNVEQAILAARPWGVDLASGVESAPGQKDPKLVAEFVQRAKSVTLPESDPDEGGPYDWDADAAL
ncbi:MAG: phosphoribosylanthranilate isomerase [Actinomycetota bacterium]